MFFILSKTAGFLALPSNLLIVVALLGLLLLLVRFRRTGMALLIAGVLLLAIDGFSPLGALMIKPLENRFPPWDPARGAPDGIIILGGAISPSLSDGRPDPALGASASRITVVAKLARAFPAARIVYSGGKSRIFPGHFGEADFVLPLLESFGIAPSRVTLEGRSRTTAENAAFTKALVNPKPGERWLLVTSAAHMPRAVGCFRRVGFPVEAYPVDWRTPKSGVEPFSHSFADNLALTDNAMHEWLGLVSYRLTGRTSELFPAPAR
jgi:uncharacterized SAM-binding protein YcdF (DUF218 family)